MLPDVRRGSQVLDQDLRAALKDLSGRGMKRLLLDIRNCVDERLRQLPPPTLFDSLA